MSVQDAVTVTESDIRAVAQTLQQVAEGLPPAQQAVLGWLIQRAASADEVSGYSAERLPVSEIRDAVLDGLGFNVPR